MRSWPGAGYAWYACKNAAVTSYRGVPQAGEAVAETHLRCAAVEGAAAKSFPETPPRGAAAAAAAAAAADGGLAAAAAAIQ